MSQNSNSQSTYNMGRRSFLLLGSAVAGLGFSVSTSAATPKTLMGELVKEDGYEVNKTEAQWRAILSENQFLVLRQEKTERKFTSPFLDEKRAGKFHCAGCDLPVYDNAHKFDSRTGWPSYWQAIPNAVRVKEDKGFFSTRTEVHCRRCGGHLGHIFADGPKPTGLRHCINGLAMTFNPSS